MASLVRMDEEGARQPGQGIEFPERLDDEGEADRLRKGPGDDLVRRGVLDRGKVASPLAVRAVVKIACVGEQVLAGPTRGELPVQFVGEGRVRLQRLRDFPQGVRPPHGAFQAVFPHQPSDFLPVHRRPEEPRHQHRDRPRPLRPALEVIDFLDDEEIGVIPGFVGVVSGPRDAQLPAHPRDVQTRPAFIFPLGPVYYLEPFFDGDFDGR